MRRVATLMMIALAAAGCRFKETGAPGAAEQARAEAEAAQTAETSPAALWTGTILPHVAATAVDWAALAPQLAADPAAAGEAHGRRPSAEGAPWSFMARVTGVVTAAKLDSRAATAAVDADGDGAADVTLQLGPVVRGTALRDALPFFAVSDYRDQIEFAQVSRDLNQLAWDTALERLPRENLVGAQVSALGAFTWAGPGEPPLLTPVEIARSGP